MIVFTTKRIPTSPRSSAIALHFYPAVTKLHRWKLCITCSDGCQCWMLNFIDSIMVFGPVIWCCHFAMIFAIFTKAFCVFWLFLLWFSTVSSYLVCIESFTLNNLVLNRLQGQSSSGAPGADVHVCDAGANVCYLLAGWAVHKEKQRLQGCSDCLSVICGGSSEVPADSQVTLMKSYICCPDSRNNTLGLVSCLLLKNHWIA